MFKRRNIHYHMALRLIRATIKKLAEMKDRMPEGPGTPMDGRYGRRPTYPKHILEHLTYALFHLRMAAVDIERLRKGPDTIGGQGLSVPGGNNLSDV